MGTGSELSCHLGVHGYHDLLLLSHHGVAHLYLLRDPLLEVLTDDSGAYVDEPLLRHLRDVRLVRKVEVDLRLLHSEVQNTLHCQVLVLRNVDVLNVVVVQVGFLALYDVLEEVDGHVVW